MLCFLLLIVLFASAQSERCPKIENVPQCNQDQIACPGEKFKDGCPTSIVCEDKWFSEDDKNCTIACWDVKCKEGEFAIEGTISWIYGYGQCDRIQDFCVKYDKAANFGIETTGVHPRAEIAWPTSCKDNEKWCNLGFDEYGYWRGSTCSKNC